MSSPNQDSPSGLAFAISAYVLWGFLPIYLSFLDQVPPLELVSHRVIWSVSVAGLVLILLHRTKDLVAALKTPRMLAMACLTAGLITCNWGTYVWAVANDRALEAALGYYINPLFSLALGAFLLKERLTPLKLLAIGLAALAVVLLTVEAGSLPWPAVVLTVSWGFYAYFKKQLPIGPNQGFLLEVLILTPPALGYLLWVGVNGQGTFLTTFPDTWLLLGCGVITAVPLMLYANGAKGLTLSTTAVLQYIAPTLIFLVAVFFLGEEFDRARQMSFPLIWAAVVIYSYSVIRDLRRSARQPA